MDDDDDDDDDTTIVIQRYKIIFITLDTITIHWQLLVCGVDIR